MSAARTLPGLFDAQRQRLGGVGVHLERDHLQVEDDVGRILDHALDGRELMQHAVDLHRGDGRAFDRRQQHAPHGVADRGAETAFERLGREAAVPIGERIALEFEPLGTLETLPQHAVHPLANGPADRPPDLRVSTTGLPLQVCRAAGR
jgi:hypothetical protein